MVPECSPACTDTSLRALYAVKDALRRKAFIEASNVVFDALAIIQNEFDWCYRTDPVLPFMRDYFIELNSAISSMVNATPELQRAQASRIITAIDATIHDVNVTCSDNSTHQTVSGRPDLFEREHIIDLYGLKSGV